MEANRKEMNTGLCMQIILNCQELRILMRTKYERKASIQKTGKFKYLRPVFYGGSEIQQIL